MNKRIGFIQGRLSPIIEGKIQAFPWDDWRHEFYLANELGISLIEWTLDQERLYENPLMTDEGQSEIKNLCKKYNITIPSLTGDCFMQAPFWKESGRLKERLCNDFLAIIDSCCKVGVNQIVIPLVDNGQIENKDQEDNLLDFIKKQVPLLREKNVQIVFESDFKPKNLKRLIKRFDEKFIGINYDIGNSASLGYDPIQEFYEYGKYIYNIHVKDRELYGTTVALGEGNADFDLVFQLLDQYNYNGNYIMQTARATDDNHFYLIDRYKYFIIDKCHTHGS